jgi:hypothetical protein
MLNDKTGLRDEKWLGTEDEERDAYVFLVPLIITAAY